MYGKEQEIRTIKAQLDLLLEKKSQLSLSAITAYDEEKKFALKKQIKSLEEDIATLRQQLRELEESSSQLIATSQGNEGIDAIRALIATGELKAALAALFAALKGEDRNTMLLLQSRINALEKEISNDTISNSDAKLERAKITKAALDLCDRLKED
jgi:cell division protein FtsL